MDPSRLIFIDETGFIVGMNRLYGWAPIGKQAVLKAQTNGKRLSVIGAMCATGPRAMMSYEATLNTARMLEYISDHLGPTLRKGDIVVMDGLRVHTTKAVIEALKSYGAETLILPPYSPELNPIEPLWSTMKARIRAVGTAAWDELVELVASTWDTMDQAFLSNWVVASGYAVPST